MTNQEQQQVEHLEHCISLSVKRINSGQQSDYYVNLDREAIADLFAMPRDIDHVVEMLKLREIYRHLSNAADRGDQAANVLGDIVVKKM